MVRIHYLYCDSCDFDFECSLVPGPFLPGAVTIFLVVLLRVLRTLLGFPPAGKGRKLVDLCLQMANCQVGGPKNL